MKLILILMLIPFSGFCQTLIGNKIYGDTANLGFGERLAISADGKTIVCGIKNRSHIETRCGSFIVYKNVANNWTQIGSEIYGTGFQQYLGRNVAISGDGSIVAISAAELSSGPATGSGAVFIYENIGNNWVLLGQPIVGQNTGDLAGTGVALSSDGTKIALTSPGNINNGLSTNASGQVRVFENISNNWIQVGQDINGDTTNNQLGFDVSMSSDGNRIAVSAICNATVGVNACVNGYVQVYENVNNTWSQIGQTLNGNAIEDQFGRSIALSGNGNSLVVGASLSDINGFNAGTVSVYDYLSNNWVQAGSAINGSGNYTVEGWEVSITNDGDVISTSSEGLNHRGQIKIFRRGLNTWTQEGNDIDGDNNNDNCVAQMLSSDGTTIVVGAWGNDSIAVNAGQVQVYELNTLSLNTTDLETTNYTIYPNPFSEVFYLNSNQIGEIDLFSLDGRKVFNQKIKIGENLIHLGDNCPSGTYILKVFDSKNQTIRSKRVVRM